MTDNNSSLPKKSDTQKIIASVLLDAPRPIRVCGRLMSLYPLTLAKALMLDGIMHELGIDSVLLAADPHIEAVRLASTQRDACTALLALYTCPNTRHDVQDWKQQEKRRKQLSKLNDSDIATLLVLALQSDRSEELIKHLGLDKEREQMQRISDAKHDDRHVTFGGRSLFGTFVGRLREMGYSDEDIIYRRGYGYLRMMLADKITTIYLTDEERAKVGAGAMPAMFDGDAADSAQRVGAWLKSRGMELNTTQNDDINGRQ